MVHSAKYLAEVLMREPELVLPSGSYSGNPLLLLLKYPLLDLSRIPAASAFVFYSAEQQSVRPTINPMFLVQQRQVAAVSIKPSCVAP